MRRSSLMLSAGLLGSSLLAFTVACSNGGASGGAGGGGGASTGSSPASGTSSGTAGQTGAGGGTTTGLGDHFSHGINYGYVPGITNEENAILASRAGIDSARLSLPEGFLETWGYDIEVANNQKYIQDGIIDNVVFLSAPSAAHSTAPQGGNLAEYIPQNLYEPIFLADGSVNPQNYWALYVEKTVDTYKDYIKVWSVWNEPDWVSDYNVTLTWGQSPPTKDQLPRFNGSIFDYVRMLRITSEVAKKVDPQAKIAVGGLGYATFLSAVLRYTDNPADGSVTADYPNTGEHWFDVVDMHYYPVFSPGSSDAGVDGFLAQRDAFAAALSAANASPKGWLVTETGAPHAAFGSTQGSPAYARDYYVKVMTVAQRERMMGVHWFMLSDGATPPTDTFGAMGLYQSLSGVTDVNAAVKTETGIAAATLGHALSDARFDPDATTALGLPTGVEGVAFQRAGTAKRAIVLWARATGMTEDGAATVEVPAGGAYTALAWDASANNDQGTTLTPSGGKITVSLTPSPTILVEN